MPPTVSPTKEILPGVPAPDSGKTISAEEMAKQDELDKKIDFPASEGHDEIDLDKSESGVVEKPKVEPNIPSLKDFFAGRKDEAEIARLVPEKKDAIKKEESGLEVTSGKKEGTTRDLTDIPEEDRQIFSRMSNESFAKLKPVYLEHKTLKQQIAERDSKIKELSSARKDGELPSSYYEHPEGYRLAPEFAKVEANASVSSEIKRHWQLQLAKIRKGEDWIDFEIDEKGQAHYSKPKTATAEAEAEVIELLQNAVNQEYHFVGKRNEFVQQFQARQKEIPEFIKKVETDFFPDYDKPDHPTAKLQQEIRDALPESLRYGPLVPLLAKTAANNALLYHRNQELEKENAKLKGVKSDAEKAPPTRGQFVGASTEKPKIASITDFQRERGLID